MYWCPAQGYEKSGRKEMGKGRVLSKVKTGRERGRGNESREESREEKGKA